MKVSLPYGDSAFDLRLPDGVKVVGKTYPRPVPDPSEAVRTSLESPVGSAPLKEILPGQGRICVLISDVTRGGSTGLVLSVVLDYMDRQGIEAERVEIVLAMGMHRGHSREELERHLGHDIVSRYRVLEHDARDADSVVELGYTPAGTHCLFNERVVDSSLIIGIGTVSFHYFAGFGGSRKLVLPGVAYEETIVSNHRLSLMEDPGEGLSEGCRAGNLEGNPVHEDMIAGAGLLDQPVFMINTVFGQNGELVFINSGEMIRSHVSATGWYREKYTLSIERNYGVVIASAGGSPKDINLLQAHKALRYASEAVDQGGLLLAAAACPEGIGSESYLDAFRNGRDRVPEVISRDYTLNSQAAMSTYDITGRLSVYLRSTIDDLTLEKFGFCPWHDDFTKYLLEGVDPADILLILDSASFLPVIQT